MTFFGTKTKNKTNKMKNHFRPKTKKKRKWPNNPFSAPKTKTNFGRLLVWWLDLSDPVPDPSDFTTDLRHCAYQSRATYRNKDSYRKQIARQHSSHKNLTRATVDRPCKNFRPIYSFYHCAKFGYSFSYRACSRSPKIWELWDPAALW